MSFLEEKTLCSVCVGGCGGGGGGWEVEGGWANSYLLKKTDLSDRSETKYCDRVAFPESVNLFPVNLLPLLISFEALYAKTRRITKHTYIILTPLNPTFIVKLWFTEVYIIFLIFAQKHRLWVLVRTASARRC